MTNSAASSAARRRAVISGGAGFLGSHLAERLLDDGLDVVCLDNFLTGCAENVAHLQGRQGFRLIETDVTDYISVSGPVDYVLHLASPASPVDYAEHPLETLKAGSLGTLHTLGLARAKRARYLLASTSEVYGDPLVHPQNETYHGNVNPVGPRACYDEAKRFAEATTAVYRSRYDVDAAIMRIFNTYGPRMRSDDGRVVPTFLAQALSGRPLTVAGDGSQTRSVCYVDDLVDGAVRMLFSRQAGPVNIGNPEEMSILELAELVRELTGSSSAIEFVDRPADDPTVRRPDIDRAITDLGWRPTVTPRDGLLRTMERGTGDDACRSVEGRPASRTTAATRSPFRKVAVVGTGYVGAVTATCLAWLGHEVHGLDSDPLRAAQLAEGQVPFREPGLPELMASTLPTGRLSFTDQPADALTDADLVFLCVGTPQSADGAPDLHQVESAARTVAPHLGHGSILINKSTVPVGVGNLVRTLAEEALGPDAGRGIDVVSNPEFLREGSAIADFLYPDRVVLGGDEAAVECVAEAYKPVLALRGREGRGDRRPQVIKTDLESAEMIKYAANAFLATKISFANEISNLCSLVGADARQVLPAIGSDHRIGPDFLSSGIGWGGSCFGKDLEALVATGREYGYSPKLLRATVEVNLEQRAIAVRKLQHELRVLKGRRIALLGLAFKPDTDDLRDAPAVDIARRLLAAGSLVSAYDPVVKKLPDDLAEVRIATDPYDAAERADAVVLATEWEEFGRLEAGALARVMKGDLVLDGRNTLPATDFRESRFRLLGFGT